MISVCIATYNGEKYIEQQLLSILKQLSPYDEIVISDDGSSDNTIEIIKSLSSPLIKIYKNEGEHGYTPNFENALKMSNGEFVFLADQDDIWQDDKVEKTLSLLGEYDMVVSDAIVTGPGNEVISSSYFSLRHPYKGIVGNIFKFGYLGCCMAFRRNVLTKALPFPRNHKMCTHDNWLFLIGRVFFKTVITNEPLIYYCRHETNTSAGGLLPTTSILFKIKYRLYLIVQLLFRWRNRVDH